MKDVEVAENIVVIWLWQVRYSEHFSEVVVSLLQAEAYIVLVAAGPPASRGA
jgi:hypothetical protein